ncbi:hypothetical protein [Streptomyces toxytricini]|uniref:hypothetical protein n=1 Tax=Streptomyces toxytricini TaxID=67369 RepID=UPI003438C136
MIHQVSPFRGQHKALPTTWVFRERGSSAGSGLVAANPDGFNTKPDGPFCHTLATESDGFEMRTTAVQSLELHRTDYCQVLAETCLGRANDWPRCPLFGAFGMSSSPRIQQSARIDDVVRAQLADWAEIFSCPSCPHPDRLRRSDDFLFQRFIRISCADRMRRHSEPRIGFADQLHLTCAKAYCKGF